MITAALAVLCGVLVGFALALTGGGGSTIAIPLLLYVVGLHDIHVAIGTSALAVSLNAYASLIPHARAGHVRWRAGVTFAAVGVVGAFALSEVGKIVNGKHLTILFAALVMVVALLMLRSRRDAAGSGRQFAAVPHGTARLAGVGLGTGAVAGFFGVGGGFLCVPGLMLPARLPMIDAIGTALVGTGSFSLTTALNYACSGLIDWPISGEFILGGIAGGWIGASLAHRLSTHRGVLRRIFSGLLIAIAIYMLIKR